jgi:CubicO group peptidase (beta-lactamase class C family)
MEGKMRNKHIIIGLVSLIGIAIVAILALILIPKFLAPKQVHTQSYWPTHGWRSSTPEEQGVDSVKLAEMLQEIQKQNIQINSLLVIRDGAVILDAYFHNPYDGTFPHDMASVTKSIMTTLIGIAADQGKIQLDQPILSYFPDRTIANLDSNKQQITVRNLAGMVNGFESGCLSGDDPTLNLMRSNPDWIQAALDRKMVGVPGKNFCYDSPGMHLLSAILQQATGLTALEFAQQYLFSPLGIQDVFWETDPQGYTHGWGDLHLYPQDAAKIGYLFLNGGQWDGQQIVPADWVAEAVKPHVKAGEDDYGYGWWIDNDSYAASGRGGQHIFVVPSLKAIVVTTGAGFEYDQVDPLLSAAVIDPKNPLPANPQGAAQLKAALDSLEKPPPPLPVGVLTETAQTVSGKTYSFKPNPAMLESASFEYKNPSEAIINLKFQGNDKVWRIGLDDQYHQSSDGSTMRGYWKDAMTFVVEAFDVGLSTYQFNFTGDQVQVEAPGVTLEGQVGNP